MQKNTRVPEALLKWIPFAKSDSYHESPRDCLYIPTHAGIRLANLRADIADHSCTDDAEIVSAALEIDADLNASEAYLLLDWPFETLDAEMPSEDCFGGVYHVYKNACAAEMWNNYRSLRILTNEVILQFLEDRSAPGSLTMLGTALKDQYDNSKDLIRKMCVQICASVPTCLGALPRSAASTEPRLNPATSGLALLWPLFVACDTPDCDEGVRRWGLDKLQSIGATMGIRQAATMVTTLTSDFRPGEPFIGFRASSGERGHFGRQAEEAKSRP